MIGTRRDFEHFEEEKKIRNEAFINSVWNVMLITKVKITL